MRGFASRGVAPVTRENSPSYVESAVEDRSQVLVFHPHRIPTDIIEPDAGVPRGDQEELGGVGAELHGRDAVVGSLVQLELVRASHLKHKRGILTSASSFQPSRLVSFRVAREFWFDSIPRVSLYKTGRVSQNPTYTGNRVDFRTGNSGDSRRRLRPLRSGRDPGCCVWQNYASSGDATRPTGNFLQTSYPPLEKGTTFTTNKLLQHSKPCTETF